MMFYFISLALILSHSGPVGTEGTSVSFLKEGCGSDNICQSNLELQYRFGSRERWGGQDFHPLPLRNGVPVISLSDHKQIALEVTVKNNGGDDAHEAKLIGMLPRVMSYTAFRSPNSPVLCVANTNGSEVKCGLGNPLKRYSEVTFYILLYTAYISLNTTEIELDLQLETTSEQKNLDPVKAKASVVIELLLSVSGLARPSQVYFGGDVKGERAMKTEDEIGSLIEYEFQIHYLGKPLKSFGTASLNIHWPKENSAGKWILYLVKINTSGLDKIPCSPEGEISPLSHIKTCDNEAKCVQIKCPLQGLDSSATILLRARLWNGTFIEDYATLNYLDIIVKASLSLDASAKNIVLRNAESESQVRVTVYPEKPAAQYSGVSWWTMVKKLMKKAGSVVGTVLDTVQQCGFFKRSKYDDSVPRYHAVRIKKEERQFKDGKAKLDILEKKQWMAKWNENESFS